MFYYIYKCNQTLNNSWSKYSIYLFSFDNEYWVCFINKPYASLLIHWHNNFIWHFIFIITKVIFNSAEKSYLIIHQTDSYSRIPSSVGKKTWGWRVTYYIILLERNHTDNLFPSRPIESDAFSAYWRPHVAENSS